MLKIKNTASVHNLHCWLFTGARITSEQDGKPASMQMVSNEHKLMNRNESLISDYSNDINVSIFYFTLLGIEGRRAIKHALELKCVKDFWQYKEILMWARNQRISKILLSTDFQDKIRYIRARSGYLINTICVLANSQQVRLQLLTFLK